MFLISVIPFKLKTRKLNHLSFPPFDTDEPVGAVNNHILPCLQNGTVVNVPGITEFTENGVILSDGQEIDVDHVIMCTG